MINHPPPSLLLPPLGGRTVEQQPRCEVQKNERGAADHPLPSPFLTASDEKGGGLSTPPLPSFSPRFRNMQNSGFSVEERREGGRGPVVRRMGPSSYLFSPAKKKVFCPLLSLISRGERGGGDVEGGGGKNHWTRTKDVGKREGGERRGGIFFKGLRRILIQLGAKEEKREAEGPFSIFFFCAPHGFSLRRKLSPRGHRLSLLSSDAT